MENIRRRRILLAVAVALALALMQRCMALPAMQDEGYVQSLMKIKRSKKSVSAPSDDPYRTGYHFQPVAHWMNDPDAPVFYKGWYHLFYQYNPLSAVWGSIRWGHAVSKDLINWRHLAKPAIFPDKWYDLNGCWTGSITFLRNHTDDPVIVYTGNSNASVQVTNLAMPLNPEDPLLVDWVKAAQNPVAVPDSSINISSFRDPTTAWRGADGRWRMLIGNKMEFNNSVGQALQYVSENFINWERLAHVLHSASTTGMWECPDFYPVSPANALGLLTGVVGNGIKYVLKNSLDDSKVDFYTLGRYDPAADLYHPDPASVEGPDGLRYDYGKFYASKTFFDPSTSTRILWGWVNESDSVADDVNRGWAGVQTIPRVVELEQEKKKSLKLWPVREVESLRGKKISLSNVILDSQSSEQTHITDKAAQMDVEVKFEIMGNKASIYTMVDELDTKTAQVLCTENSNASQGRFGLMVLASQNLTEATSVFFNFFALKSNPNITKTALCVDLSKSTMKTDADTKSFGGFVHVPVDQTVFSLRVLVDRSIVESFAERGKTVITTRSYPTIAVQEQAHLLVFSDLLSSSSVVKVKSLNAWRMKTAKTIYDALV